MDVSLIRWITFILTALLASKGVSALTQSEIDQLALDISVTAEVVTNLKNSGQEHTTKITLKNTGTNPIQNGWRLYFHSFYLLYPTVFPKNKSIDLPIEKIKVIMVQGDLYALEPLPGFKAINFGESRDIEMIVKYWSVSRTDYMPRWYLTSSDGTGEPRVLTSTNTLSYVKPFTEPRQWKRYDFDQYNPFTAQDRKERLEVNDAKMAPKIIIPTPKKIDIRPGANVSIDSNWRIYGSTLVEKNLANLLSNMTTIPTTPTDGSAKVVRLRIPSSQNAAAEGYTLHINSQNIELTGNDESGLFYAVQSLISILEHYSSSAIPQMTIEDSPRFPYRGMFVDVARNFHTVSDLKRIMSVMSMYKMNHLHIHLADDEGWRLEIPDLPELTEIASKRCHDLTEHTCIIPQYGSGPFSNTSGSGFFTAEDYRTILQFAKDHYIEVIPEFDMPGHAHAAIVAMENRYKLMAQQNMAAAEKYRLKDPDDTSEYISVQQWSDNAINPCINSTYKFIEKVVREVKKMHEGIQPLKTYHFGGDEVAGGAWEKSPICEQLKKDQPAYAISKGLKRYFAERVSEITAAAGVGMRGWEDGYMDKEGNPFPQTGMENPDMSANPWDNIWEWGASQRAYRLANAGYKVVMSQATDLYFDHPQEPDPEERGLYWATRFTDSYKTFGFMPDSLYDNIKEERSGKPLTKAAVCGADMSKCDPLNKPENVIGMQGHLWGETISSSEILDYMIFPRLLALAERAWHKAEFENLTLDSAARQEVRKRDWTEFANTLGYRELKRLDKMGVMYRVPPPGASIEYGKVKVSVTYPGLVVQYKKGGQSQWKDVTGDIPWTPNDKAFFLKTLSADRQRESRQIQLIDESHGVSGGRRLHGMSCFMFVMAVTVYVLSVTV